MFRKNNQQDTPPNLFFHTPDSSITPDKRLLSYLKHYKKNQPLSTFLTPYVKDECIDLELSVEGYNLAIFIKNLIRNVLLGGEKDIDFHIKHRLFSAFALNVYAKTHNLNPAQFSFLCRYKLALFFSHGGEYSFFTCVRLFEQTPISYHSDEQRELTCEEKEFIDDLNKLIGHNLNESYLANILLKYAPGICLPELYSQFASLTAESYKQKNGVKTSSEIKPIIPEEQSKISLSSDSNNCQKIETIVTINNQTQLPPLLIAAEEGDLSAVKTLLHDRNNTQQIANSNRAGDTALSLAAKNSHFAVVDYLIRYHYLGISFNNNEVKALNLLSKNNQFRFYFQLLQLLTTPDKHKEIKSLLEEVKSTREENDLSAIYLLYLWMNVHSNAQTALGSIDSEYKEPSMSQLTTTHQSELILHMIREGYVLKDWYINSNELIITDMLIDKKQVDALEQLLQQGQYQFCLKADNQPIEEGKIYISFDSEGLHYTVLNRNGIRQVALIAPEAFECPLIAPLTLDQLQSLPKLLEKIAQNGCDLRPSLERLILSKVRFTKKYQLCEKEGPVFENILYIDVFDEDNHNAIKYIVLAPTGKRIIDTISYNELLTLGWNKQNDLVGSLDPIFAKILEITSRRGHTIDESHTKGYSTFLNLLGSQLLAPKLQTLHLCDCDLFDNYDMPALYPVLAKNMALEHLNFDNNHITEMGLQNLLDVVQFHKKLRTLSLCFNDIEVKTDSALRALTQTAKHVTEVKVTGNRFADKFATVKKNHHKRVRALLMLFSALSEKEPNLTIELFLTATNVELDNENYLFSISIIDSSGIDIVSRKIDVILTKAAFGAFDDLRLEEIEKEQQSVMPLTTPQDIFSYLISGITPSRIPRSLASSTIFPDEEVCRQLLYRHINAPLKGHLLAHSLFRTEKITKCPSFLYPNEQITSFGKRNGQGLVYLIANDRNLISFTEHSMLAYEYLTSYGQHIFKVAHLRHEKSTKTTYIKIEKENITSLISWLPHGRLIARFRVDSHRIKKMHHSILQDTDHTTLPETEYSSFIPGSSVNKEQKMMNCLTYCLKKMRDHLNIRLVANPIDYRPSAFVRRCIQNQSQEENILAP